MLKTALSNLIASMHIPALYKRLQDIFQCTLIFQVAFLQPCIKLEHGPVQSGGQRAHPCLVQAPAEHLPMPSHLPGAMPTTMYL